MDKIQAEKVILKCKLFLGLVLFIAIKFCLRMYCLILGFLVANFYLGLKELGVELLIPLHNDH